MRILTRRINKLLSLIVIMCLATLLIKTVLRAKGPLAADDPGAITLLRQQYLQAPDDLPYDLREDWDMQYTRYGSLYPSWGFIHHILKDLYAGGPLGYFVEAGALDGEYLSNTLHLERQLGWTGLLIEAEEESYAALRRKHRKAWSSKACVGAKEFPYEAVMTSFREQGEAKWSGRGAARLEKNPIEQGGEGPGYRTYQQVQCFPLLTFLLATNTSAVDLFSLDVEGAEWDILKSFPFDRIPVDVWVIEHVNKKDNGSGSELAELSSASPEFFNVSDSQGGHGTATSSSSFSSSSSSWEWYEDPEFVAFMESRGYYLLDVFCHPIPDYVFVRLGSAAFHRLGVPRSLWRRRGVCGDKGVWKDNATYDPRLHRDPRHWPSLEYFAKDGKDGEGREKKGGGVLESDWKVW
ncbi:uncharacterized protein LOC126983708 isoform X2 [Eriocheir sinensis]|uniref:uncharacterized protein LOC126983708 isoform X2 n=1 Tax=Eriocheir sinensis TaxID=95602 RepID=UPI0021C5D414|nr:uncharacterized protein LOC126983708 isoform X2 [Eriocheir sinensis]